MGSWPAVGREGYSYCYSYSLQLQLYPAFHPTATVTSFQLLQQRPWFSDGCLNRTEQASKLRYVETKTEQPSDSQG